MANCKIEEIEGIGPAYAEKLQAASIKDTDGLLEKCCSKAGRKEVCESTGLSSTQILKWTNMVDLFRIKGVAGEYAELLECAGVDTVVELGTRNAENLAAKLAEMNKEKKLTRRVPPPSTVADWVSQAKDLPRKMEY